MGIYSWDLDSGFSTPPRVRTPRLTVRCEYPDTSFEPTVVTFGLSPRRSGCGPRTTCVLVGLMPSDIHIAPFVV